MKILHVADLHLGKVVHGVSMLDNGDQPYWVDRFLELTERVRPQAVLIAGDVYDRSSPSGEAVALLSRLLEGLAERGAAVLLCAGNHDSGQRLAFAPELLARQGVHIAGTLSPELRCVTLEDECGPVAFRLMPYVFPALVGAALGDDGLRDYDTAVRRLLEVQPVDPGVRNVLVAHQNVTAQGTEAERGGSESAVGGVGQVDFSAFDPFDYVALGHIHASCPVGRETVRYAGSPLCYHFNETRQPPKGAVLVELGPKGTPPRVETVHIPPLHPMRELRGPFEELRDAELAFPREGEYLRLVLTDRPMTPEISALFQSLAEARGSVLMDRCSEFRRFSGEVIGPDAGAIREKPLEELFADFWTERSGDPPDAADLALLEYAGELLRNRAPDPLRRDSADRGQAEALLHFLMRQEGGDA